MQQQKQPYKIAKTDNQGKTSSTGSTQSYHVRMLDTPSHMLKKLPQYFFPSPRPTGAKMAAKTMAWGGAEQSHPPAGRGGPAPSAQNTSALWVHAATPTTPAPPCARGTPVLPLGEDFQPFWVSRGDHARMGPCLPLRQSDSQRGTWLRFTSPHNLPHGEGNQEVRQLGMSPALTETAWIPFSPGPRRPQDSPPEETQRPTRPGLLTGNLVVKRLTEFSDGFD